MNPAMILRKGTLALSALAIFACVSGAAARTSIDPLAAASFIADIGARTVEVLEATDSRSPVRDARIRAIFANAFDVKAMAEEVVHRSWNEAETAERNRFYDVFATFLLNNCVRLLDRHEPDGFKIVQSKKLDSGSAVIKTDVTRYGLTIASIDWLVEQSADGFRIVDVVMNKISTVRTYRADFRGVIRRRGFDGLLQALHAKAAM